MKIGERIKYLRNKKGWTQVELAKKINMAFGNVGDWERNRSKPGADALLSLAEVFNTSVDWLLTGMEGDGISLSTSEKELISKLRELPERDLEDILVLLELKHKRKLREDLTL